MKFDHRIARIFRDIVGLPLDSKVFVPTLDACDKVAQDFNANGLLVSGMTAQDRVPESLDHRNIYALCEKDLTVLNVQEKFHGSFAFWPFYESTNPRMPWQSLPVQDRFRRYTCSTATPDFMVPLHVLGLEMQLRSLVAGGYMAAVLPKRWQHYLNPYLQWWELQAASIAEIRLPEGSVTKDDGTTAGDWRLCIWTRAYIKDNPLTADSGKAGNRLEFAQQRYSKLIFPVESLDIKAIEKAAMAVRKTDWYKCHIHHFGLLLKDLKQHGVYGRSLSRPYELEKPETIHFFSPPDAMKTRAIQAESYLQSGISEDAETQVIETTPRSVHILPTNAKTNLRSVDKQNRRKLVSEGLLLDAAARMGVKSEEDRSGNHYFTLHRKSRRHHYATIAEELHILLQDHGLVPMITPEDARKSRKVERFIDIQLTPYERWINIQGLSEEKQSSDESHWELLYEDSCMKARYPEIWNLWASRAKTMKYDRLSFEFQFQDVVNMACRQSATNSNVMGLGKTRETILMLLLRGFKKVLIVLPAGLIQEWKNEIQDNFVPYARRQLRDWQKRPLDLGINIITSAADCQPSRLRRFNFISTDLLKRTPTDGVFYKCPECGMVVYTARKQDGQTILCPGDPGLPPEQQCHLRVRRWREECVRKKLFKEKVDSTGKKISRSKNSKQVVEGEVTYRDPRPPKPTIPTMERQQFMFKKFQRIRVGTNADGEPVWSSKQRRPLHVKWTFAELLRDKFNAVVVDEAQGIKNLNSQKTLAVTHLCAASRYPLTGTPIKGYPQSVLSMLNWCYDRRVFPNYRIYEPGGLKAFMDRYKTEVMQGGIELDNGKISRGKPKLLPKINNPALFQAEMAAFFQRRVRNEPEVKRDIPQRPLTKYEESIPMDPEHREYYEKWLVKFAEWWAKMKEEEEGKKGAAGELLVKINYLVSASTTPRFIFKNILEGKDITAKGWANTIGPYKGPPPRKLFRAMDLVTQARQRGDKILIFSTRSGNLDLGDVWCKKKGIPSVIIDGRVSTTISKTDGTSPRSIAIQNYRTRDYTPCWASLGAMSTGVNLPEANIAVFLDQSWEPSETSQAMGRMIRPQQRKDMHAYFLMHQGTIDEYMAAWNYLKLRSSSEGIDYQAFSDFSSNMIPDIHQYADAIVDGTEAVMKRNMWLLVEQLRASEDDDDDLDGMEEDENGDDE